MTLGSTGASAAASSRAPVAVGGGDTAGGACGTVTAFAAATTAGRSTGCGRRSAGCGGSRPGTTRAARTRSTLLTNSNPNRPRSQRNILLTSRLNRESTRRSSPYRDDGYVVQPRPQLGHTDGALCRSHLRV